MQPILIGLKQDFHDKESYEIVIDETSYLLIQQSGKYYFIENRCGHFGISLSDAKLEPNSITCSGHYISFDLTTGEIINRPYESCDKIKTFEVIETDTQLFFNKKPA